MLAPRFCTERRGEFIRAVRLVDCDAIKIVNYEEWDMKTSLMGTRIYAVQFFSTGINGPSNAMAAVVQGEDIVYVSLIASPLDLSNDLFVFMKQIPTPPAA